ncbi:Myosin light chain kinase, smooth muscle [Armadillidium vulgare]|nr:Myosin light chain kinase, smooth muscle [Armadillidium vulgare]
MEKRDSYPTKTATSNLQVTLRPPASRVSPSRTPITRCRILKKECVCITLTPDTHTQLCQEEAALIQRTAVDATAFNPPLQTKEWKDPPQIIPEEKCQSLESDVGFKQSPGLEDRNLPESSKENLETISGRTISPSTCEGPLETSVPDFHSQIYNSLEKLETKNINLESSETADTTLQDEESAMQRYQELPEGEMVYPFVSSKDEDLPNSPESPTDEGIEVSAEEETGAIIVKGPKDTIALKGQSATLTAYFKGYPEPEVYWYKKEKEISVSEGRFSITTEKDVTSLTIRDVTFDDCDKYTVKVINNLCAHSAWYGSTYDGGRAVTGYRVEGRKVGNVNWVTFVNSCHSTSYKINGLERGAQYEFRVKAENIHGVSEPSKSSNLVTLEDMSDSLILSSPYKLGKVQLEPGDLFEKKFDQHEELGKGRYGVVYRVSEKQTGHRRAAKLIKCIKKEEKEKLIDFGLAKKLDPDKQCRVLFGTPEFVAPEVINYDPISFASDMWSVGVICYVLKRLTASECLRCGWLAQSERSMKQVVLSTDKLKRFIIRRKWQVPSIKTVRRTA